MSRVELVESARFICRLAVPEYDEEQIEALAERYLDNDRTMWHLEFCTKVDALAYRTACELGMTRELDKDLKKVREFNGAPVYMS